MEASPVEKLVYVLLLAALKKKAERIDMRAGRDAFVVDFTIDGMRLEEMRPPALLREPVFDRLREMTGDAGRIHLVIGEDRHVFFTVALDVAGPVWRCELRPIASVD